MHTFASNDDGKEHDYVNLQFKVKDVSADEAVTKLKELMS